MSTTCQNVIARAVQYSTANAGLASDQTEMMRRINFEQQRVFDRLARMNRFYYGTTQTATSTTGASGRSILITANVANGPGGAGGSAPVVGRILKVTLPSLVELNQVDLQDLNAELSPRYYPMGKRLYEVGSDWDPSSSNAVTLTIAYVQRAPAIADSADPVATTLTLDDEYADLIEMGLAAYLAHKDLGRPADEIERLGQMWEARFSDFVDYIDSVAGPMHQRFVIPNATQQNKA